MHLAILAALALGTSGAPMPIPDTFNPDLNLVLGDSGRGMRHSVRHSAGFARELVAHGAPEDIALAVKVLDAVIACQETHDGAHHRGNFLWTREEAMVNDLNSVEFVLQELVPMMRLHGDRLPPDARDRVLASIRLGLDEIRNMDVAVTYTNIAAMDCANSIVGGELVGDDAIAARGYAKLARLAEVTAHNGTIFEFNSPTYTRVTLRALQTIADLADHEPSRIRAMAMGHRLALSYALHIHPPTGHLAGPHSRAYRDNVIALGEPERESMRGWIADGYAPAWIETVLAHPVLPRQIRETAHADWRITSTAFHTPTYALGLASREISRQTDVLILHYTRPGATRPGVMYSRYLINTHWADAGVDNEPLSERANLFHYGKFLGVQEGSRAIGVYAPRQLEHPLSLAPASTGHWTSAKATLIWTDRATIDAIYVNGVAITTLPHALAPGDVAVVTCGDVYVAVRPYTVTNLGIEAPVRLIEKDGNLVLELHNYLGAEKLFNELEWKSRFYRGQPQCGFYLEVADRDAYPDGAAFARAVASGTWTDEAAPPFTAYMEEAQRPWTLGYARDGQELGLEVDLMQWSLLRRWTEDGPLGWPQLEAPEARQTRTGRVDLGGAVFTCGQAPAWLYANPAADLWVAGYHGDPAPAELVVPDGRVTCATLGTGVIVWDRGTVTVEALGLSAPPVVQGGRFNVDG